MLSDPTAFLESLMKFDKESITEEMIKKLKRFVVNPDYDPAKIIKVRVYFVWLKALISGITLLCKKNGRV